jgi:CDP-diacylglycerol---glycerol-3-phosphate 3-phosphatidyltransferase
VSEPQIENCSYQDSLGQIETIRDALRRKMSLHMYLQLDYNRSTRPGSSSSVALVVPLLKEFPDRCHVSLFRSPKLKGVLSRLIPPRFNEGFGTWHAKIYGADDTVMISG